MNSFAVAFFTCGAFFFAAAYLVIQVWAMVFHWEEKLAESDAKDRERSEDFYSIY